MTRPRFGYLFKEAGLFLAFCFLLFFAGTWRALADYDLIRVGVAALGLTSLGWLALGLRSRLKPMPLAGPLTIFLGVYLIAALISINPRRSLDEAWVAAMYVFVFAGVAQLVALGWPRELFVKALLIAGALMAGLAGYIFLSWYLRWLSAAPGTWLPDIAFRLPLANGTATLLYLLTLSAMARFIFTSARLPRFLLGGWILAASGLLYLTASRGGWLATAAGVGVLGIIGLREAGGFVYLKTWGQRVKQRWQVSLVAAALGLMAVPLVGQLAARQISNPEKTTASNARVEYWVPAWNVFLQKPLFGQGPLTFGSAYLRDNSVPPYSFFAHAHSIYFNLLAETGLAGFAAFGILAAATFVALGRRVTRLTGQDRAVAAGALACAVAWAVHGIVDSVNVEPMNSVLLAALLGAALGDEAAQPEAAKGSGSRSRWIAVRAWWPVALGGALAATGWYNVWRLEPYHQGVRLAVRSQWAGAAPQFAEAIRRDPGSVLAYQQSGLVNSLLAQQGEPGAIERAIGDFESTTRLDPDWWLNHANLAALYLAHGDPPDALQEYRAAVKLGSGSPLLQLNYGIAAETAGEIAEAKQAYLQALNLKRGWAEAYFWRESEFRRGVLKEWRAVTSALPVLTLSQMQALSEGGDRSSDYAPLAAEYIRLGRLEAAGLLIKKAELAYAITGEDRLELLWLKAELAAARGDFQSAVQQGQLAVEGYEAQSVFGPGAFGTAPYGLVFYRQETMAVDLVPQLTLAPFTDRWAARLVSVGDWYAAQDDETGAEAAYRRVLTLVPDNAAAADRLEK